MKRVLELMIVLLLGSAVPAWGMIPGHTALKVVAVIVLSLGYLAVLFRSGGKPPMDSKRLRRIKRGTDLIWIGGFAAVIEAVFLVFWFIKSEAGAVARVFAVVMPVLLGGTGAVHGSYPHSLLRQADQDQGSRPHDDVLVDAGAEYLPDPKVLQDRQAGVFLRA